MMLAGSGPQILEHVDCKPTGEGPTPYSGRTIHQIWSSLPPYDISPKIALYNSTLRSQSCVCYYQGNGLMHSCKCAVKHVAAAQRSVLPFARPEPAGLHQCWSIAQQCPKVSGPWVWQWKGWWGRGGLLWGKVWDNSGLVEEGISEDDSRGCCCSLSPFLCLKALHGVLESVLGLELMQIWVDS